MSIVTRKKSIVEDRDTVMRMVKAHIEGIAYFRNNKDFAIRVLSQQLKIKDRETLENSYDTYKQDFIPVPYPIMKGLEATYDYVAQTRPEIRAHKPEEFMDPSFIAELDKSGFIKKLYESKLTMENWKIDNFMILNRYRHPFIFAAFAALLVLPLVSGAQDKPLKKITWGMTALTASMWIPWLAKEARIYEKNGLDVEIILLRGSGQSSQALLGG